MKRRYLGPKHKDYSEKCQREVAEMQQHPLTHEQFLEQIERNHRLSDFQKIDAAAERISNDSKRL